ncbi:hypothetical protein B0T10DRAFT_456741 [Thelonectria olida]|uniref:Uncharacterized protein n=1 Tax=Thelonectria olida TaxID=1576542 RepID=A0A9P9AQ76_9HYPO|nr:hypothetical protein B0T10DRAFT_456741 [Thelonectria olida]
MSSIKMSSSNLTDTKIKVEDEDIVMESIQRWPGHGQTAHPDIVETENNDPARVQTRRDVALVLVAMVIVLSWELLIIALITIAVAYGKYARRTWASNLHPMLE